LNTKPEDLQAFNQAHPSGGQHPVQPPSTLRIIFIGADGLRAGWSLLIFCAITAALIFAANTIGHKLFPPTHKPPADSAISLRFGFIAEGLPFLCLLLVTWIMSKIERRPLPVYGFGDDRKLPHFFAGLAWGITCVSLLVFTLWKAGLLVIDSRLLFGRGVFGYGALWLLGFLLVGLLEEYLSRGYVQYTLTRGLSGSSSASGTAIIPGNLPSAYCPLVLAGWFSASVFGARARFGGPSAFIPRGTGLSLSSTVSPTAE
jgi:hypothetical protein